MNTLSPPRWRALFEGSVPKHDEFAECNEDKYRISDEQQVYVLSDGASESFNSSLWAEILVDSWLHARPKRDYLGWLRRAAWAYRARSDPARMSWSQEAAFARGSFASLLAVEADEGLVRVTAVGDSIAVLTVDEVIRNSFPYSSAEHFDRRPDLLSTILERNKTPLLTEGVRAIRAGKETGPCHAVWRFAAEDNAQILCMTDALGAWLLAEHDQEHPRLKWLLGIVSGSGQEAFRALVERERASGLMRRDDTTLIILGRQDHAETPNS
jgi:hypothetical protein